MTWRTRATLFSLAAVLFGAWCGLALSRHFTVTYVEKDLPDIQRYNPVDSFPPARSFDPFDQVILPDTSYQNPPYASAIDTVLSVLERRTGVRPTVVAGPNPSAGRSIVVLDQALSSTDAYRLTSTGSDILVTGNGLGLVYALYELAARAGQTDLDRLDLRSRPAIPDRFVDWGGVGILPDSTNWGTDYKHHSGALEHVIGLDPPYIDAHQFRQVERQFETYVQRVVASGYNGIVVDGFIRFVDFENVGDGESVYGPASDFRPRHDVWRAAYGRLYRHARDAGLKVVMVTDMLALTRPLEDYLRNLTGSVDAEDARLWETYADGVRELFEWFPYLDGLMIRIGEAGAAYDVDGSPYYHRLGVTTDAAVQEMVTHLAAAVGERGKPLYLRSWSIGIGEIGDLHTNPETYDRVFGGLQVDNLTVSTKFVRGDFDSYQPFNPTLEVPGKKRLIEFQARREFEAFNAIPNHLGPLHREALRYAMSANPNVDGIWLWTQAGGPLKAGPLSIYPFYGFWQLTDLNVDVTGKLAWDPNADVGELTNRWIRKTFGSDPAVVRAVGMVMHRSREAILKGLYVRPFAEVQPIALGVEIPPRVWVWDIVTGSNILLSSIYATSRDEVDAAIDEGFEAVSLVRTSLEDVRGVERTNRVLLDRLEDSLTYQESLFETLALYRQTFLAYYAWIDTGQPGWWDTYQAAAARFEERRIDHLRRFDGDLDFPAYNFEAADQALQHFRRTGLSATVARALLGMIAVLFLTGALYRSEQYPPGLLGTRRLWTALFVPWRPPRVAQDTHLDTLTAGVLPFLILTAAHVTFSSYLSIHHAILVTASYGTLGVTWLLLNRIGQLSRSWAVLNAPLVSHAIVYLVVISIRGSGYLWFLFWTNAWFRAFLVGYQVATILWMVFVLYVSARETLNMPIRAAFGQVLVTIGTPVTAVASLLWVVGLETFATSLNNELVVMPLAMSKTLGITTHMGIPQDLPAKMFQAGLYAVLVGAAIRFFLPKEEG